MTRKKHTNYSMLNSIQHNILCFVVEMSGLEPPTPTLSEKLTILLGFINRS